MLRVQIYAGNEVQPDNRAPIQGQWRKKLRLNLDLGGFLKGLTGFNGYESREPTSRLGQSLPRAHAHKELQHSSTFHEQVAYSILKKSLLLPSTPAEIDLLAAR